MFYKNKYLKYKRKYLGLKEEISEFNIPLIGFGCGGMWRVQQNEISDITHLILHALKTGYRCLDCARIYDNEEQIKNAMKYSDIPRNKIYIIGKAENEINFNIHIKKLDLEYIDLGLIHWYDSEDELYKIWHYMCKKKEEGIMKNIGVSNIELDVLIRLNKYCEIHNLDKPLFIQNKINIYMLKYNIDNIIELIKYCKSNCIHIIAHSPLGGEYYNDIISDIKPLENNTIPQIMLRLLINDNITVIPSARNEDRISENFEAFTKDNFIPKYYNII